MLSKKKKSQCASKIIFILDLSQSTIDNQKDLTKTTLPRKPQRTINYSRKPENQRRAQIDEKSPNLKHQCLKCSSQVNRKSTAKTETVIEISHRLDFKFFYQSIRYSRNTETRVSERVLPRDDECEVVREAWQSEKKLNSHTPAFVTHKYIHITIRI